VVALLAALPSCGGSSAPSAIRSPSPTAAPPSAVAASPSSVASPAATVARAVYYLHDTGKGLRLYREFHRRPATAGVVRDAVTAMLTEKASDADYTSL